MNVDMFLNVSHLFLCISNNEFVVRILFYCLLVKLPPPLLLTGQAKVKTGNTFPLTSKCKSFLQTVVLLWDSSTPPLLGVSEGWCLGNKYINNQSYSQKPQQKALIRNRPKRWRKSTMPKSISINGKCRKSSHGMLRSQRTIAWRMQCSSKTNRRNFTSIWYC